MSDLTNLQYAEEERELWTETVIRVLAARNTGALHAKLRSESIPAHVEQVAELADAIVDSYP